MKYTEFLNLDHVRVTEDGFPTRTYEIVSHVPEGFFVWHIGDHGPDGFIALCEDLDKDDYTINTETLKAIPHDKADEIMHCARYATTASDARDFIAKHRDDPADTWKGAGARRLAATIEDLEEIF